MAVLVDTNILGRLANTSDAQHATAARAVLELHRGGEVLSLTPQVLVEFRCVATRPVAVNGLGLTGVDADALVATFESRFPLLPDMPDIFPAWKAVVAAAGVIGKQVHDARLVAACHVHAVPRLLTFNVAHFARLAVIPPGIQVIAPTSV